MTTATTELFTPQSLGLPPRFQEFRPQQLRGIRLIETCQKRHLILPIPTGGGKSAALLGAALKLGGRTLILTGTRHLQDQYKRDFSSIAVDLRGKANYECILPGMSDSDRSKYGDRDGRVSCDFAPCSDGWKCFMRKGRGEDGEETEEERCLYFKQLERAKSAQIVITNYACWLAQANYSQGLGGFDRVFLDEAHNAGEEICRFLEFNVRVGQLKYYRLAPPSADTTAAWLAWAIGSQKRIKEAVEKAPKGKPKRELKDLQSKVESLVAHGKQGWVITRRGDMVHIEPVWPFDYLHLLTGTIPQVVLVSATLTRKTVELLGIGKGDFDYREFSSTFAPERRPLYFCAAAPGNSNCSEEVKRERHEKTVRVIDKIIQTRPGVRGIIHSVSYKRAEEIYESSAQKDRLVLHERGVGGLAKAVERYMVLESGILVSPGAAEGVDLPHDGCRFQILAKVPFPDWRDPVTAARTAHDKEYVNYLVGQIITQTYGRVMRDEEDWGETFIIDTDWAWMRGRCAEYVPDHVWDAHETVMSVPKGLEL